MCNCGITSRKGDLFCRGCGNELSGDDSFLCECGAEVEQKDSFCHSCGVKFEGIEEEDEFLNQPAPDQDQCSTCGSNEQPSQPFEQPSQNFQQ